YAIRARLLRGTHLSVYQPVATHHFAFESA
ncbi:hypothetical protein D030_2925B, partial [Vibrio parahaemolyticus AQ3810]